jgi:YD repeat-containing protein
VGFGCDYRGRRTSVPDGNSKVTQYAYDDADRLTTVTDANTNQTQYGHLGLALPLIAILSFWCAGCSSLCGAGTLQHSNVDWSGNGTRMYVMGQFQIALILAQLCHERLIE